MTVKSKDFFEQINQAFLEGNADFIAENVSEDVVWTMAGEKNLYGKEAFVQVLNEMESGNERDAELTIERIIETDLEAAVIGRMSGKDESGELKSYMYCDVYRFDEDGSGKIKELTAFIVETKE
jgi:ketosteroid isomerase-like protein